MSFWAFRHESSSISSRVYWSNWVTLALVLTAMSSSILSLSPSLLLTALSHCSTKLLVMFWRLTEVRVFGMSVVWRRLNYSFSWWISLLLASICWSYSCTTAWTCCMTASFMRLSLSKLATRRSNCLLMSVTDLPLWHYPFQKAIYSSMSHPSVVSFSIYSKSCVISWLSSGYWAKRFSISFIAILPVLLVSKRLKIYSSLS